MVEDTGDIEPGTTLFGRYRLVRQIARGGMASVYLAQLVGAHGFAKWVAVKVIHPHFAQDKRLVAMFLDEMRVASRLHHSNICSVLDFGTHDGVPCLVMEFLEGVPLSAVLRRGWEAGPLSMELVARILADASLGLHSAHELEGEDGKPLGVVHRDVSPQNLFVLFDGSVKVLDFGVARARGRISVTQVGEVKGKAAYMSPEQVRSGPEMDRRSDVWALGVILWEGTVGRRLFRVSNRFQTVENVLKATIPRPSSIRPGYPALLEEVVMGALQRDPKERISDARTFASALERYLYSTAKPFGAVQVADWVASSFADRIPARRSEDDEPSITEGISQESDDDLYTLSSADFFDVRAVDAERPSVRPSAAPPAVPSPELAAVHPVSAAADFKREPDAGPMSDSFEPSEVVVPGIERRARMIGLAISAAIALGVVLAVVLGERGSDDRADTTAAAPADTDARNGDRTNGTPAASAPSESPPSTKAPIQVAAVPESNRDPTAMDESDEAPSNDSSEPDDDVGDDDGDDDDVGDDEPRHNVRPRRLRTTAARRSRDHGSPAPTRAAPGRAEPTASVQEPIEEAARNDEPVDRDPARERDERPAPRADPDPGFLNLLVIPSATVTFRGRALGKTPLVEAPLPPGTHTLTLRPDQGPAQEITVIIRPGETTRRSLRLGE